MSDYKYLPTQDGGFIRKAVDRMTEDEKEFLAKTRDINARTPEDVARYQQLAEELLYSK